MPKGHRIFTTTRDVPVEFPFPTIGETLAATNFVAGFTSHIILDASESPLANRAKRVTVTHGTFPTGSFTEYESQAYTFPAIYPNGSTFQPGGCRPRQRVVPARIVYEYRNAPGDWLTEPSVWNYSDITTGPFEVKSYIAEAAGLNFVNNDGSSGRVGDYLNPFYIGIDTINNTFNIYDPENIFYQMPASVPNATLYASWVSDKKELMASRTIHKWYCGYMRRTAWVRAQ